MEHGDRSSELIRVVGIERFRSYIADGADVRIGMARHRLNMALSEALYPTLHSLEIALRNAINEHMIALTDHDDWYMDDVVMTSVQRRAIQDVLVTLGRRKKEIHPSNVVSSLPLGFWTSFFNRSVSNHAQITRLIRPVFSFAPKHHVSIPSIDSRLTAFRHLRNRIFHHERILHWKDLAERHRELNETLRWISPELASICAAHDRFVDVHTAGLRPWL